MEGIMIFEKKKIIRERTNGVIFGKKNKVKSLESVLGVLPFDQMQFGRTPFGRMEFGRTGRYAECRLAE